jgi:hypothetical protein
MEYQLWTTGHAVVVAKADQLATLLLLNHFLELRAEHIDLTCCIARLAGSDSIR